MGIEEREMRCGVSGRGQEDTGNEKIGNVGRWLEMGI